MRSAQNAKDKLVSQSEDMTRKFNALTKENNKCNAKFDKLNDKNHELQHEADELKELSGRQKQDAEKMTIQLRGMHKSAINSCMMKPFTTMKKKTQTPVT